MRQFSGRYAIHALRNLPEKELRYFNTVIVTADIDEGLTQWAYPFLRRNKLPSLTFSHRSGVTPYTSSCEFAGSCVFNKQSPESLSLRPAHRCVGRPYCELTAAILPSSLRKNHSYPLGYSPYPPVSVSGTDSVLLTLEVFRGNALNRLAEGKPPTNFFP